MSINLSLSSAFSSQAYTLDISTASIVELKQALRKKRLTCEQIVKYYLARIEQYDANGPKINSIVELNENAINEAISWDKTGDKSLPLGGIPFLVKDNFNVKGMANAAGSIALLDNIAKYNATLVQLLLDNGAIFLGRTNMSELAASFGKFGYSSRAGQTLNPLNLERDPSGSSSGSSAAVAAGFCAFALGTDTSGSVRGPATVTGLVGYRPSMGMLSRHGILPLALSADTAGPLVRNVDDLAIVMDVLSQKDPADSASAFYYAAHPQPQFVKALEQAELTKLKLGFVTNFNGGNPEVDNVMLQSVEKLKRHGVDVENIRLPEPFEHINDCILKPMFMGEFKPQFESHLTSNQTQKSLKDVVSILSSLQADKRLTAVNPGRLLALKNNLETNNTDCADYIVIQNRIIPGLRNQLDKIMNDRQFDGLIFATRSCPAAPLPGILDPNFECHAQDMMAAGYIAAALGLPEITVPAGLAKGNMPISLSFMGRFGQDEALFQFGKLFESIANFSVRTVLPCCH
ncbi:Mandelamide hydrolase [Vibrio thalassae]|uniref:Mandelamide hydrolase n=1 Tax=Vibrio thalassae TaxID=1243014 RepID=A0A240ELA9_9VIBR|nr:amidase [Vibrio thalassae]SNX49396.1 Mandelamide hydrolase [Vibrio thalassae]